MRLAGLQDELGLTSVQYQASRLGDHRRWNMKIDSFCRLRSRFSLSVTCKLFHQNLPIRFTDLFHKPHANPLQPISEQNRKARDISPVLYDRLGSDFWSHSRLPEFWGPRSLSLLPGIHW